MFPEPHLNPVLTMSLIRIWLVPTLAAIISIGPLLVVCVSSHNEEDTTPSSDSSGDDSRLSWQSAFWALLAIALNTATQPSGRIAGFPSSWGPALKCSPVFCIVNVIETLGCLRLRHDPQWTLVVAPTKYYDDHDKPSAPSDVASLQRNTLIRVITFILGPLLQATKLYACHGILFTQLLAAVYLASFLCDELVLSLMWLTGSDIGQDRCTGFLEALLCPKPPASTSILSMRHAEEQATSTTYQAVTLWVSHVFLLWFMATTASGLSAKYPHAVMWMTLFITFILGPIFAAVRGIKSFRRNSSFGRIIRDSLPGVLWSWYLLYMLTVSPSETPLATVMDSGLVDFHGKGVVRSFGWKILWVISQVAWALIIRDFATGADRHGIPRPVTATLVMWATAHLLVAMGMFKFAHDPTQTYKPSWTDVLG
ncbi:hypothetical protein C8035_v011919 [Colletotrichum spinosum]|uniref:Uncharacterized protein n=1 Tax=Colletotrichum spinosum TaxID=1347390 RepID=A0A4R8QHK9_9PEZI|nr:hypothetical protein C8035_v011919 [Colletotrichum spinosum]